MTHRLNARSLYRKSYGKLEPFPSKDSFIVTISEIANVTKSSNESIF